MKKEMTPGKKIRVQSMQWKLKPYAQLYIKKSKTEAF